MKREKAELVTRMSELMTECNGSGVERSWECYGALCGVIHELKVEHGAEISLHTENTLGNGIRITNISAALHFGEKPEDPEEDPEETEAPVKAQKRGKEK